MPYCGHYGCGCCTCEKCGQYNDCVCDLAKRSRDIVNKFGSDDAWFSEPEHIREMIDLLDDWQGKFPEV